MTAALGADLTGVWMSDSRISAGPAEPRTPPLGVWIAQTTALHSRMKPFILLRSLASALNLP